MFEGYAKARGKQLHIVPQILRGGEEQRVGHQDRGGDVIQQADADEHRGFGRRWCGAGDDGFDGIARLEQRKLEGHLESAAFARQRFGEEKGAGGGVEVAEGGGERADGDRDAVFVAQALGNGVIHFVRGGGQSRADLLGLGFQDREVVGGVVEEVARFLGGEQDLAAGGESDGASVFARDAPGAVEGEDRAGGVGRFRGELRQFGFRAPLQR